MSFLFVSDCNFDYILKANSLACSNNLIKLDHVHQIARCASFPSSSAVFKANRLWLKTCHDIFQNMILYCCAFCEVKWINAHTVVDWVIIVLTIIIKTQAFACLYLWSSTVLNIYLKLQTTISSYVSGVFLLFFLLFFYAIYILAKGCKYVSWKLLLLLSTVSNSCLFFNSSTLLQKLSGLSCIGRVVAVGLHHRFARTVRYYWNPICVQTFKQKGWGKLVGWKNAVFFSSRS